MWQDMGNWGDWIGAYLVNLFVKKEEMIRFCYWTVAIHGKVIHISSNGNGYGLCDEPSTNAMVGHWGLLGKERLKELTEHLDCPFIGGNVFDTEWEN